MEILGLMLPHTQRQGFGRLDTQSRRMLQCTHSGANDLRCGFADTELLGHIHPNTHQPADHRHHEYHGQINIQIFRQLFLLQAQGQHIGELALPHILIAAHNLLQNDSAQYIRTSSE